MKVYIGPYTRDIIPVYRWENKYASWRKPDSYYLPEEEYTKIDKIVFGFFDMLNKLVLPLNSWSNSRKRKINIRIDNYDVWSADHTLAMIIHPVLLKLKEQKQGSPYVDDDDVPEHLKSTAASPKENEWDIDDNHHLRSEWVLDEMIWAFKQCTDHDHGDNIFHHNSEQLTMTFEPTGDEALDSKNMSKLKMNHQKDPTKPAYWVDQDGKKAHYERIKNGHRLFAKYYFGLWD
jgi:hypothetical protein